MAGVRDGLVDLDAPITEYLSGFTVNSIFEEHPERRITLRHLLSHTAGFTHEAPVGNNYDIARGSFAERVASIPDSWLRFSVGERYEYSNLGIDLAGWVLAVRSGMTFEAHVQNVLLGPLGLTRTTFDLSAVAADEDRAIGHRTGISELPVIHPLVPCGGAFTSVMDACRFVQFHLNCGAPLLPASLAEDIYRVPSPVPRQEAGYALGIVNIFDGGRLFRGHGGGGFGYRCDLYWLPEEDLGVVVLTNSTEHPVQWDLARSLLGRLSEAPVRPVPPAGTPKPWPSADVRARLEGEYLGRGSVLHVSSTATGLEARLGDGEPITLTFCGEDSAGLAACAGDWAVRFVANSRMQREVVSLRDGNAWSWNRGPNERPEAARAKSVLRSFVVRALGLEVGRARLWRVDERTWFGPWGGSSALRLTEHQPDLFFSSTGEALDLTKSPPTYANIPLCDDEGP